MTRFDQNKSSSGWTLFSELNIRENINSRTYTRLGYHTTSTLIYSVRKGEFSHRTSREAVRKSGDREERGVYFFPWHNEKSNATVGWSSETVFKDWIWHLPKISVSFPNIFSYVELLIVFRQEHKFFLEVYVMQGK